MPRFLITLDYDNTVVQAAFECWLIRTQNDQAELFSAIGERLVLAQKESPRLPKHQTAVLDSSKASALCRGIRGLQPFDPLPDFPLQ